MDNLGAAFVIYFTVVQILVLLCVLIDVGIYLYRVWKENCGRNKVRAAEKVREVEEVKQENENGLFVNVRRMFKRSSKVAPQPIELNATNQNLMSLAP